MTTFSHYSRWWLAGIHLKKGKWIPNKKCRECQRMAEGVGVRRAELLLPLHDSIT